MPPLNRAAPRLHRNAWLLWMVPLCFIGLRNMMNGFFNLMAANIFWEYTPGGVLMACVSMGLSTVPLYRMPHIPAICLMAWTLLAAVLVHHTAVYMFLLASNTIGGLCACLDVFLLCYICIGTTNAYPHSFRRCPGPSFIIKEGSVEGSGF